MKSNHKHGDGHELRRQMVNATANRRRRSSQWAFAGRGQGYPAEYRLHGERTLPDRFGVSLTVIRDIIYNYNWHDPNYVLSAKQAEWIKYLLALGRSQWFIAAQLGVSRNVVARLMSPPDNTKIVRRL
jgi:hypothetical protein